METNETMMSGRRGMVSLPIPNASGRMDTRVLALMKKSRVMKAISFPSIAHYIIQLINKSFFRVERLNAMARGKVTVSRKDTRPENTDSLTGTLM